jgi:prevent-host-death family protein
MTIFMVIKTQNMDNNALPAGEFKATCLAVMDEVAATGREVIITKRGKPVAKLVPYRPARTGKSLFGALAHTGEILGDIVSPTPAYWGEWPSPTDPIVIAAEARAAEAARAAKATQAKSSKAKRRKHVGD